MQDRRNVFQVLKAELSFLEQGGYRRGPRHPWRPNFVFEDSPTCINFKDTGAPRPCTECLLTQFVPEGHRKTRYPCRHILLTSHGESVNSFYEWGTEEELETALKGWLKRTIRDLEEEAKSRAQTA